MSLTETRRSTERPPSRPHADALMTGVMGVGEQDLIEGVQCLGAAAFLDFAADADVQLFI